MSKASKETSLLDPFMVESTKEEKNTALESESSLCSPLLESPRHVALHLDSSFHKNHDVDYNNKNKDDAYIALRCELDEEMEENQESRKRSLLCKRRKRRDCYEEEQGEAELIPTTTSSSAKLLNNSYEEEDGQDSLEEEPSHAQDNFDRNQKNIKLNLIFTFFGFFSRALYTGGSVLPAYVYLLRHNDLPSVGWILATSGAAQLLFALPAGALSDVYGRARVLHFAAMWGVLAVGITCAAIYTSLMSLLLASLVGWGGFWGMTTTCTTAHFADSISTSTFPTKQSTSISTNHSRSKYFTQRTMVRQCANLSGPTSAAAMFVLLGDAWTRDECAVVLYASQIAAVPAMALLLLFQDPKDESFDEEQQEQPREGGGLRVVKKEEESSVRGPPKEAFHCTLLELREGIHGNDNAPDVSQGITLQEGLQQGSLPSGEQTSEQHTHETHGLYNECNTPIEKNHKDDTITEEQQQAERNQIQADLRRPLLSNSTPTPTPQTRNETPPPPPPLPTRSTNTPTLTPHRKIALSVATSDMLAGLASGMSIRYFPLFFLQQLHLPPALVQSLYICCPLGIALTSHQAQKIAQVYGRCPTTIGLKWMGVGMMGCMIGCFHLWQQHSNKNPWLKLLVCLLFIVRTILMNSTGALTKSLLMDAVPPSERGKWSALESVNMFSWSGSAAVGGWLVGRFGMVWNFGVTAGLQVVATLPLVGLVGWWCRGEVEEVVAGGVVSEEEDEDGMEEERDEEE